MERTEIAVSPGTKILGVCAALLCLAAFFVTGNQEGFVAFLGGVGVIFFGLATYLLAPSLFKSGPALIIDDEGVTDRSPLLGVGLIPWEEIQEVGVAHSSGRNYLVLTVTDPDQYLARTGPVRRFIAKLHRFPPCIPIDLASLNADPSAVAEAVGQEAALRSGAFEDESNPFAAPQKDATDTVDGMPGNPTASGTEMEDEETRDEPVSSGSSAQPERATEAPVNQEEPASNDAIPSDQVKQAAEDIDALEKLAELRDKGILTEEEFARKKKQILDT